MSVILRGLAAGDAFFFGAGPVGRFVWECAVFFLMSVEAGVARDAFYILTHPGELDAARDRLAQLEAAFAAA